MTASSGVDSIVEAYAVSRETTRRLELYVEELNRWQKAVNLVGRRTLHEVWTRHIADSLQLVGLGPHSRWVDLGSGAGLPGLVVAAAAPGVAMTLVESDTRKCAFLRHASRAMDVAVQVVEARIENLPRPSGPATVSARALAPLDRLLRYSEPWLIQGGIGLFPKGTEHGRELTQARESWRFEAELIPSRTDPDARIIRVTNLMGR